MIFKGKDIHGYNRRTAVLVWRQFMLCQVTRGFPFAHIKTEFPQGEVAFLGGMLTLFRLF